MDEQTKTMLRSAFFFLEAHEEMLEKVLASTNALRKTIEELVPDAATLYDRHTRLEATVQTRQRADEALPVIQKAIRDLQ